MYKFLDVLSDTGYTDRDILSSNIGIYTYPHAHTHTYVYIYIYIHAYIYSMSYWVLGTLFQKDPVGKMMPTRLI